MKQLLIILTILTFSLRLLGQDTAIVRQQANLIAKATIEGDSKTVIAYTYPKLVSMAGGKNVMASIADSAMKQLHNRGITIESVTIGSPGAFYKAGNEIHCLVPEKLVLKVSVGRAISKSYLLAISDDEGKT
jgi:hypothetical protein